MTPYWTRVIERAKQRKREGLQPFTEQQIYRAMSWVTCACGKQDPRIPRRIGWDGNPCPVDEQLYELGAQFYNSISDCFPTKAEKILARIERRSAEILKGLK